MKTNFDQKKFSRQKFGGKTIKVLDKAKDLGRRRRCSFAVWAEENCQMSIKVAQK